MPGGELVRALAAFAGAALLLSASARFDGTKRIVLTPERAAELYDAALVARNNGRARELLTAVDKLLSAYPRDGRYLELQATAFNGLKDYRSEAASWEQYFAWSPAPLEACPRLGRAYERLDAGPKALDAHRRCLELDPEKTDLQLDYARALASAGRAAEAASIYESILKNYPGYLDAALFLGRLKLDSGDTAGAAALIEPVITVRPDNSDPLLFGALVDLETKNYARAESRVRRAIKESPRYTDLYRVLARICDARSDDACSDAARLGARALDRGGDPVPLPPETP